MNVAMAGGPILTLDADAEAPGFSSSVLRATTRSHDCLGARVLAAGRGRFAVWVGEGDSEEACGFMILLPTFGLTN